jgi:osmotically-inducible protein OsmY
MEALFMQQSSDQYFTTDQDLALQRMIYDHLNWDKRVSPFDIQVEVVEGNVILSGIVDAHYKKKAAYELIESLEGVWEIENRIQVDTHMYRTDEHIKEILLSELRRLSLKPGENVTVNVQDGVLCKRRSQFNYVERTHPETRLNFRADTTRRAPGIDLDR